MLYFSGKGCSEFPKKVLILIGILIKKEFLKHEKTEYNISALEKTLLQNTTHKNISTLIIKQAGIKSIPANVLT